MSEPLYLRRGNDKLGRSIWTWSMPAVTACGPAPSEYCERSCYAIAFRRFPSVVRVHERNQALTGDLAVFRRELSDDLRTLRAGSVVRLHVAGDFFSANYAKTWLRLVSDFEHLTFYGYTRAWTDPEIRRVLTKLRARPNVSLWASSDWTMRSPPTSWLEARVFPRIDDARSRGYVVCPEQLGMKPSCDICQLCWRVPSDSRFRLAFIDHRQLHRAGEGKHSSPAR